MKKLFYLSLVLILGLYSCNSEKLPEISYVKAGFGQSHSSPLVTTEENFGEDVLMGQLPMKVVLKIEKSRRLRYMQLTNVIKYVQENQDSILYDLTFESPSGTSQRKSVLFDQHGNKIYR